MVRQEEALNVSDIFKWLVLKYSKVYNFFNHVHIVLHADWQLQFCKLKHYLETFYGEGDNK